MPIDDPVLGAERRLFGAGKRARVPGRNQLDPAPVELDRAAEVRVADRLDALALRATWRSRRSRRSGRRSASRPERASAMWSTWPWLIAMWVGSTSSAVATAAGLLGLRNGSTRTRRLALAQLEARLAVELDLHLQSSPSGSGDSLNSSCSAQPTATPTIIAILASSASSERTAAIRSSGSGAVAAFSASASWDSPNQPPSARAAASTRCSCGAARDDDPLGLGEALGVGQPLDRGLEPLVVWAPCPQPNGAASGGALGVAQRGGDEAGEAADRAADEAGVDVRGRVEERQREQHRGGDGDPDPVVLLVDRARASRRGGSRTRRRPAPSAMPLPPAITSNASGRWRSRLAASMPSEPQATSSSAVAALPRRRSRPIAEDRQGDRDDEQVADVDVGEGGGEARATSRPRSGRSGRRRSAERVAGRLLHEQQARRSRGSPPASRRGAGRARPSPGAAAAGRRRRRGLGSSPSPRRSSFGARLRRRAPQYGHSVT